MIATVKFNLSPAGQKAALVAGLKADANQTAEIEVPADAVDLFDVRSDGSLTASAERGPVKSERSGDWLQHAFDAPPTAGDILAFLRDREAARKVATAKAEEERRQKDEKDARCEAEARATAVTMLRERTNISSWNYFSTSIKIGVSASRTGRVELSTSDPDCGADVAAAIAEHKARQDRDARHTANLAALPKPPSAAGSVSLQPDGSFAATIPSPDGESEWSKRLTSVDLSQQNGMAFEGPWLKCGGVATLNLGDIVVVGAKSWQGGRRSGSYVKTRDLYVMTGAGLLNAGGNTAARAAELLLLTPEERMLQALARRLATCDSKLAALDALDADTLADVAEEAAARRAAWTELRNRIAEAHAKASEEPPIEDIPAAAAAIIAAGYKALASTHHPDKGGNATTMALLTEARAQLRELLTLAAEVQP